MPARPDCATPAGAARRDTFQGVAATPVHRTHTVNEVEPSEPHAAKERRTVAQPARPASGRSERLSAPRFGLVVGSALGGLLLSVVLWGIGIYLTSGQSVGLFVALYPALLRIVQCGGGFALGWHLPADGRPSAVYVVLLTAAVLLLSIFEAVAFWVAGPFPGWRVLAPVQELIAAAPFQIMTVAVFIGIGRVSRRLAHRQQVSARVEAMKADIARARADKFRARLQPEFVVGQLELIRGLATSDPRQADWILVELSHLLRLTLSRARADHLPLREEVGYLSTYLTLRQAVSGGRSGLTVSVPPPLGDALVPSASVSVLLDDLRGADGDHGLCDLHLSADLNGNHLAVVLTAYHPDRRSRTSTEPAPPPQPPATTDTPGLTWIPVQAVDGAAHAGFVVPLVMPAGDRGRRLRRRETEVV